MAVIRAKRLWLANLPPTTASTKPVPTIDSGGPRTIKKVYTCPPGKRAIIRTITCALTAVPAAGNEPTYQVVVYSSTFGWCLIHYFWFVDHSQEIAVWKLDDTWNGQLVLHAGDYIELRSQCPVQLDSSGSGHELNELAS